MSWEAQRRAARVMTVDERDRLLRTLADDTRLPAVLALIACHEDAFVEGGSAQRMAGDGNKQSHAWGSVHALRELAADLARIVNERPARVRRPSGNPDAQ